MLTIDGSIGEGGGQILRTALSLSLVTGREFRIENIRANRSKPGLLHQHLAAVSAAAAISQAEAEGAALGSQQLTFRPRGVSGGEYRFATGTAGSATLVLQTVLPALLTASQPSALVLEGGTHNPFAPPFEFIHDTFLPTIERTGARVRAKLDRHGFYPAGGGKLRVTIQPATKLARVDLLERGNVIACRCRALVSELPPHIAERELKVLKRKLPVEIDALDVEEVKAHGPGNVVLVEIQCAHVTEVFVGFGERGVRAEAVAEGVAKEAREYLNAQVPIGKHLADQLLLPMALASGGSFVTLPLTQHALTNLEVLNMFLPVDVKTQPEGERGVRVEITSHPR